MDASWTTTPAVGFYELRAGRVLGVDLNADRLAACVLDASGNLIRCTRDDRCRNDGVASFAVGWAGLGGDHRDGRIWPNTTTASRSWWRTSTSLTPWRPGAKPWAAAIVASGCPVPWPASPPPIPHPADRDGVPARYRCDRCGSGLHLPLGCAAFGENFCNNRLPPSHRHHTSWCGGRDRQTWTRHGDQASAGWSPTADRSGHESSAACPPTRHHDGAVGRVPATPTTMTRRAGPPGQHPPPTGQHRSGRTRAELTSAH